MNRSVARTRRGLLVIVLLATTFLPVAPGAVGRAQEPGAADPHAGHDMGAPPASAPAGSNVAPLLGNLGNHRHAITTRSALAQRYFDEGLNLMYGFNHAEAIRSYRDAATLDPACAMCYWGIALSLGPNINARMRDAAVPDAYEALQQALSRASGASAVEQALIQALAARYAPAPVANRAPLDRAYADAMRDVVRRFPDDLDAATLFAEALMDLSPWRYWTRDGEPTEYATEIVATLESVLARNPSHPGATHFYIHAVEASQTPERAVPAAERLETLVPGAGHLVHMPGHTYWRVGRYQDAIRVNLAAIQSDESYIRGRGVADLATHGSYVYGYYPHNIEFVFAGAQMSGQSALALDAARKLVEHLPQVATLQPMPLYALVRFGRWDEVMREPQPADDQWYALGMWHWARGLAYLRQGDLDQAETEAALVAAISGALELQDAQDSSGSRSLPLLELARNVLAGELAGAQGRSEEWLARLAVAVALQDDLPYSEPPPWFYPVRHNLGAALLKLGRVAEAEAVYREDLRHYPHNAWGLFGLAESLRAQGRAAEAAALQPQIDDAWQYADVPLTSSGF
jgi:tetratricopeptide (TPR) repeat protein